MVLKTRQAQSLMEKSNNLHVNTQVQIILDHVNSVLIQFEGKTNTGYPQGPQIYIQEKRYKENKYDKLDISVSNAKDIIDHFISIDNKHG